MKIITNKTKFWKAILNTIDSMGANDMFLNINKDEIYIKVQSGCTSMGYVVTMPKSDFLVYDVEKELILGVSIQSLNKVIKRADDKNCEVIFETVEDDSKLKITLKRKRKTSYKLNLSDFDPEDVDVKKFRLTFSGFVNINTQEFVDSMNDLVFETTSCLVTLTKDYLNIKDKNLTKAESFVRIRKGNNNIINLNDGIEKIESTYNPEFILKLLNGIPSLSDVIKIEFDKDYPMQITVKSNNSVINAVVAPKVDIDEGEKSENL